MLNFHFPGLEDVNNPDKVKDKQYQDQKNKKALISQLKTKKIYLNKNQSMFIAENEVRTMPSIN